MTQQAVNDLSYRILGCAIEVHKELGPGLLESVYERCLRRELDLNGFGYRAQQIIELEYKGLALDAELRCDLIVEDLIVVELKAVEYLLPIHDAVLFTYMKMLNKPKGILINFNCVNIFKEEQKTLVNELFAGLPKF